MIAKGGYAPIEFFLWTPKKTHAYPVHGEQVSFYDEKGEYCEREVPRGLIDKVLAIFDGNWRTVPRSSGGIIAAEPYQIVIYDSPEKGSGPDAQVRVRVRFRDFKRDAQNQITSFEYLNHHKIVQPTELGERFQYRSDDLQRFVLDFGQGIVPVHVFQFQMDDTEQNYALFVEPDSLRTALERGSLHTPEIPVYWTQREVLRWASERPGRTGKCEWEQAQENYQRLKALGAPVIPECLSTRVQVTITGARSGADFRHQMRDLVHEQTKSLLPTIRALSRDDTDALLPFGLFEKV